MKFTYAQLKSAILSSGLPPETYDRIVGELEGGGAAQPRFEAAHVSYYLGALLVIGAMGWFITSSWDRLAGGEVSAIAFVYALVFATVGAKLWNQRALKVPGGLLVAVAVCMVPLLVYGIERQFGWWPASDPGSYTRFHPMIDGSWIVMELCTIAASTLALRFVRFPFITAPAAYALWYMSMDATAFLFKQSWTFKQECKISVAFGLAMLLAAFVIDGVSDCDFSFWFYLFGLLTFTGGLSLMGSGSQLGRAIYCLIHFALIVLSLVLQRKAFLVFGGIGVFAYLSEEAATYFKDSLGFTFALTLIGIAFIVAGILYKKNERKLTARFQHLVPQHIRNRFA